MDLATAARDHKYLLDIGGNSGTTWTALAWKLASGALVFKAKSVRRSSPNEPSVSRHQVAAR
tara:strand:- start:815 stop:1000 length:186 start_codon:yes stop_codon:yes gene_type:complete